MTLAMETYFERVRELADDLETTTEVIEKYLSSAPQTPKKVYIGGGEILPCWLPEIA